MLIYLSELCSRFVKTNQSSFFSQLKPLRWCSRLEPSPRMQKVGCSNPSRDKSKPFIQIKTVPLPNARQQVLVSKIVGDDHKRMPRVTVGVTR